MKLQGIYRYFFVCKLNCIEFFLKWGPESASCGCVPNSFFFYFTETEFYNRNAAFSEGVYELLSTVSLPREMSFAEEPIKASKPFIPRDPTEQPEKSNNSSTETLQHKSSSNILNLIPTSIPTKVKSEKVSGFSTEQAKDNERISVYAMFSTMASVLNATPVEESHEIYNNDKDREVFQDSGVVKKSIKMEVVENIGNSLKNIASKSSESEEEGTGDRTYNIEGTFEANDFINLEPINVYKKIDLTPLESATATDSATSESGIKSTEKETVGAVTKTEAQLPTTQAPSATSIAEIQATSLNSTTSNSWTTQNFKFAQNGSATTLKTKIVPSKRSPLLSGAQDEDDSNLSKRKRRVINSERHSFYPKFLGRILG